MHDCVHGVVTAVILCTERKVQKLAYEYRWEYRINVGHKFS